MTAVRSIVLEIPDWPVAAFLCSTRLAHASDAPVAEAAAAGAEPIAILRANTVVACSPAARAEGVRIGCRRRDAQARCPALRIVADDPARDHREFLPAVRAVEERAPGVQVLRPGLCALRARGPARYYGGEAAAVHVLQHALANRGFDGACGGVADGVFTAEQAARRVDGTERMRVVPPGDAARFLAPLPIADLGDPALADLLVRLGVHTLGAFAALDEDHVQARLGERGVRLRSLAGGIDSRPIAPRIPPPELERLVAFEPPLDTAEQVAFAVRTTAESFIAAVDDSGLVCTEARIELQDEEGGRCERVWLHPACFTAVELVDRVRWQLEGARDDAAHDGPSSAEGLAGPVARVRIAPEAVDAASRHQPGLFGRGSDERLHHALSRVQAMLGHRGVVTSTVGGGRWLSERQVLVPWGDRSPSARGDRAPTSVLRDRPWPGSLPAPLPTTVFPRPMAVDVRAFDGGTVEVDDRGVLSAPPAVLTTVEASVTVVAWTGPWPVREREWDAERRRIAQRFQVVDAQQTAWLLVRENGGWWVEGRYD
jgi:protein ImuB